MEHHSLNSKPRPKTEKDAPFQPLSSGSKPILGRFLPHLVQNKEHTCTGHVTIVSQYLASGSQFFRFKLQLSLHLVQNCGTTRVRNPEKRVPIRDAQGLESLG
ncbi:hypothetical protein NC651_000574 [Populus alba x Populus x berolinensis]|nr:hypothetical protein NC651_000574 [Populus alba x Populus x berolinensis]